MPRVRWAFLLFAAVVATALGSAGIAVSGGFGAFQGISAAQHPRTKADRLDPSVVASIISSNKLQRRVMRSRRGLLEPGSARFLRELRSGARVYAVAGTGGQLCAVVERVPHSVRASELKPGSPLASCGSPLTQKVPTTVESFRAFKGPNGESPALSWGIALDGAAAVSFPVNQHLTITVPVRHNAWVYQGKWSATVRGFTVHFTDGHTQTIP